MKHPPPRLSLAHDLAHEQLRCPGQRRHARPCVPMSFLPRWRNSAGGSCGGAMRLGEKAAPAATASLPETYTGSIKRSVNASKTHEGEQNDGGPAGHMAGGRARGWGGGRSAGGSGWGPGRWRERASRCEPAQCAHPHGTPRARSQATHALLPRLSSQRGACGAHTHDLTDTLSAAAHVTCLLCGRSVHFSS